MQLFISIYLLALALFASSLPVPFSSSNTIKFSSRSAYTQEVWERCHLIWDQKLEQMESGPDGYYAVATASDDCPLPNLGSSLEEEEDTVVVVVSSVDTPPLPSLPSTTTGNSDTIVEREPSAYSEEMYNRCHVFWDRQYGARLGLGPDEWIKEAEEAAVRENCPIRDWYDTPDGWGDNIIRPEDVVRRRQAPLPDGDLRGHKCKDAWQALFSFINHCEGFEPPECQNGQCG
ncbi:hypothetical protein MMC13_003398 [Lambiella insularis]|nr:hypothetical protein [Lambiella insularis]